MIRLLCVVFLLAAALPASAQPRYVSDELAIVLRGTPATEGASLGVLTSGAQVEVLESDAAKGYARVRSADGREGWVLERYLKDQPIARERLQRAEKELAAAQKMLAEVQAELKKVKDENARLLKDFSRIADSSGGVPVISADTQKEVEDLRAQIQRLEQESVALRGPRGDGLNDERMMMLGGALVAGGVLLALLLHWLWPKRRWGDL